ncbi:glyoxylate reductase/hydroxypyruvate reductase-like [Anneissia japonica]|uniref:glyoxylate reductase/hydroxypyruvate reductase-like n=1 Tax=Anneissia japonica TaxID=1529436 RepID=UPI0014258A08|nr:glyoxylate reductase/hydroxypyruvate reductase-like [Anneissia japonica]
MDYSMTKRIFVTRQISPKAVTMLKKRCNVIMWESEDQPVPRNELLKRIVGCDGLYCLLTDNIDVEVIDAAGPNLKIISTMSAGFDHIDIVTCKQRNITVGFTPDVLTATAELTVALLLMVSRRTVEGVNIVKSGGWGSWKPIWMCGSSLSDSTVGIVGLGRIGLAVARRLKPFGVKRFLYNNQNPKSEADIICAEFVSFDKLLRESDFVVICCPLTPDTKEMFSRHAFEKMKSSAILINTSRGGIIQHDDLYQALKTGQIKAAGLDVTTPEPLPSDHQLLSLTNCVVLPHIGSATEDSRDLMAVLAAENLLAGLEDLPMPHEVNIGVE